ncbi:retron Ec67 family RNA-directed DNA polymerase/endonuclease [Lactiplantibacillus plantarum]|uniref:retron Ec67 family RNA-directed DNA polymerase/endonuclease n=1 Tax=Lactiplantibacillus plantarum TaxID=1590 RepID=UPI0015E864C4|nr:retron Ec67 family RNA-directed DNA polymerase/endonuclease [Lactiplantibacillus plantarum]
MQMNKSAFFKISTRKELANALDIRLKTLTYILYKKKPQTLYTNFSIPKKSGGTRDIVAPEKQLANIQIKIAQILMSQPENDSSHSKASHGFIKNRSILTNAQIHRNKKYVLNTDIKDFFPSFSFGRVLGFFEKNNAFKMEHKVAVALTNLCCYNQSLPQGAPSSPPITNLIFHIIDFRIIKLAKKYHLDYTRYVDDLTFSTNENSFPVTYKKFLIDLNNLIDHAGFSLNQDKTHLAFKNSRQEVTGIIVNEKLNVHNEFYKSTRAMADKLYKTNSFSIDGTLGNIRQLDGRFTYINQLVRYNKQRKLIRYRTKYSTPHNEKETKNTISNKDRYRFFTGKEQQYRKFSFYEYFVYGNNSIILTEGKTDITYIKVALKKYAKNYPDLIKLQGNKYDFLISFLNHQKNKEKRSKNFKRKKTKILANQMSHRIPFFLGISEDGGTTYSDFLYYYAEMTIEKESISYNMQRSYPNYPKYFISDLNKLYKKKVIILLDNEGSNHPLDHFIKTCAKLKIKKKEDIENDFKNKGYSHLKYNLFLLTIPKKNTSNSQNCAIESLLNKDEIEKLNLKGKSFSSKNNETSKNSFGKQALVTKIKSAPTNFDLSGFRSLLDLISKINSLQPIGNEQYKYKKKKVETNKEVYIRNSLGFRIPIEYQSITQYKDFVK